jgi:polysaccharide biosynthesis protein PslH
MNDLLYLVHRIPYPPNKGDKIRSFNILKHLAGHYRVHLGAFVDDPDDWRYREDLAPYCASLFLCPLHRRRARVTSLRGFLTGAPLTVPYYHDRRMERWVRDTLESGVSQALVFSSAMAQYLPQRPDPNLHTVVDFVDVDSDKWRQYAAGHGFPMKQVYQREARRLLAFERATAARNDFSLFVSEEEAALFRALAPESAAKVHAIDNGVDTAYFSPDRDYPNPYAPGTRNLVFTGAMDYWANVDAVTFFADEVFPQVREAIPEARFVIVGARPAPAVQRLGTRPGVTVTGAVHDVRPYLAHAQAAVAPLRVARGVQNKVLEAMAMARPVIVTQQALDGLRGCDALQWRVGENAAQLAAICRQVLLDPDAGAWGARARECVCRLYRWAEHVARIVRLLDVGQSTAVAEPVQADVGA